MEVKVNMDINVSAFVITIAFSIMAIEEGTKHFGDIYEHYSDGFIDKVWRHFVCLIIFVMSSGCIYEVHVVNRLDSFLYIRIFLDVHENGIVSRMMIRIFI